MTGFAWIAADTSLPADIKLELFKFLLSLILLALGWFVGQRIVARWDIAKKRQETDIATAAEFQMLYGELKEVARVFRESRKPEWGRIEKPKDLEWALVNRAVSVESKYEAVVIKLSTERALTNSQRQTLGLFRQGIQQLRLAIRRGETVSWGELGSAYVLFNDLAAEITWIISQLPRKAKVGVDSAKANLTEIAKIRSADWQGRVDQSPSPLSTVAPQNPSNPGSREVDK